MTLFKNSVFFIINGNCKSLKNLFFSLFFFFYFSGSYSMESISIEIDNIGKKNNTEFDVKQNLKKELGLESFRIYNIIRAEGNITALNKEVAFANFSNIIKGNLLDLNYVFNLSKSSNFEKEERYLLLIKNLKKYLEFFVANEVEISHYIDKNSLLDVIKGFKKTLDLDSDCKAVQTIKEKYNLCFKIGLGDVVISEYSEARENIIESFRFFIEKICCCCFRGIDLDQDLDKVDLYRLKEKCCKTIDSRMEKFSKCCSFEN